MALRARASARCSLVQRKERGRRNGHCRLSDACDSIGRQGHARFARGASASGSASHSSTLRLSTPRIRARRDAALIRDILDEVRTRSQVLCEGNRSSRRVDAKAVVSWLVPGTRVDERGEETVTTAWPDAPLQYAFQIRPGVLDATACHGAAPQPLVRLMRQRGVLSADV